MNSLDLLDYLHRCIDPTTCRVLGVMPRDLLSLQQVPRFPACCIVNTDDSTMPGQHWVAYYFYSPNVYEFFDSYGYDPRFYKFDDIWSWPSCQNVRDFQPDDSSTCGQFCLYYLHAKSLGFSMSNIYHSFSTYDQSWNDKLVRKFLKRLRSTPAFIHEPSFPSFHPQRSFRKHLVLNK